MSPEAVGGLSITASLRKKKFPKAKSLGSILFSLQSCRYIWGAYKYLGQAGRHLLFVTTRHSWNRSSCIPFPKQHRANSVTWPHIAEAPGRHHALCTAQGVMTSPPTWWVDLEEAYSHWRLKSILRKQNETKQVLKEAEAGTASLDQY